MSRGRVVGNVLIHSLGVFSNFIHLYIEVQSSCSEYAGCEETGEQRMRNPEPDLSTQYFFRLLFRPPFSLVPHSFCHNPLVWFPHFSGLVSSFGLKTGQWSSINGRLSMTYRHTPWTHGMHISLGLTSSTTMRMIGCILLDL